MKPFRMPRYLHDTFGESQTWMELAAVTLFAAVLTTAMFLLFPAMSNNLPMWRVALALILVLDIFAGCIANFTRSTNDYYAARPNRRRCFIAIHFHIVLVALALGAPLQPAWAVWAYTVAGALLVNMLKGSHFQLFVAGLLLAAGLSWIPLWPGLPDYMQVISQLFVMKLLFSFAVDHYGSRLMKETVRGFFQQERLNRE